MITFFIDEDNAVCFTCPCCNSRAIILTSAIGNYTAIIHINCLLRPYLFSTDIEWGLDDIEHYKLRLLEFFYSSEYTSVIKREILKQL